MKVAVIGAGVAGLATAWSLARAGVDTHVFDMGRAGAGATWASAGMLTPWQYQRPESMQRACEEALALWPGFAETLENASGMSIGCRRHGAIRVAQNDIEAQSLKLHVAKRRAAGGAAEILDPLPPFLTQEAKLAAHFADEAHVDNRALGTALAAALRRAGGHLHEGERIVRVLSDGRKILGVETPDRRVSASAVVVAAGAWSGALDGLPASVRPPVAPRKGQILALDAKGPAVFAGPLSGMRGYYAVPRADGRVIVGATVEDAGFQTQTDAHAIRTMAAWIKDLVIRADEWRIAEVWAGLRPATPDDLPVLGPCDVEGLFFATGQFRDGILMAPWLADWVSLSVMGGNMPQRLQPFAVARFRQGGAA